MLETVADFGTVRLGGVGIPLRVYGYGLMLVVGFLLAVRLARWRARRAGEDPEVLTYCGVLSLIGGIVGARLAYVIEQWDSFSQASLGEILNTTSGGLIYYGGVVLATAMVLAYLRLKRAPIRRHLDMLAAGLMVGLAFGRAGCTLKGCCFGARCDEHWALGMRFPMYSRPLLKFSPGSSPYLDSQTPTPPYAHQLEAGVIQVDPRLLDDRGHLASPGEFTAEQTAAARSSWSLPVRPAQLLAMANALVLAALVNWFYRLRRREGQAFALLAILYPITRFVLELVRADNPHDLLQGVLTHNQYTSLVLMTIGIVFWMALYRLPASAGPARAQRQAAPHGRRMPGADRR